MKEIKSKNIYKINVRSIDVSNNRGTISNYNIHQIQ